MDFNLVRYTAAAVFALNLILSMYEVARGRDWHLLVLPVPNRLASRLWFGLIALVFVAALASPMLGQGLALLDWVVAVFVLLISLLSIVFRVRRGMPSGR